MIAWLQQQMLPFDVSEAVLAVTLTAYQQQQQRSTTVWNLIMDDYDDDT